LNQVEVIKAGMTPRHDELDNLLRDLPFPQKQEIPEGLDRYDCPGSCRLFHGNALTDHAQLI